MALKINESEMICMLSALSIIIRTQRIDDDSFNEIAVLGNKIAKHLSTEFNENRFERLWELSKQCIGVSSNEFVRRAKKIRDSNLH